jgi:flagellar M-ring protein FliF
MPVEAIADTAGHPIAPRGNSFLRQLGRLPIQQKLVMMAGAAAAVAIVAGAWLWSQAAEYRVLFANMADRDGGATIAALSQMNVPYRIAEGGGAILVPADKVHDTRLKLASQGLPKGGIVGFELVDNQKFGATQFQEQINYQRALEGELARSIQSLSAVQSARVHLAIPKPSVFLREQQTPTASVLLTLHTGRTLDRAQVSGIVHLVASSVPELAVDHVNIVDQTGALLSRRRDGADAGGLDPSSLQYVKQVEQATIQRIVDILEPIVGRSNARVQVTADVDFTRVEAVAETFRPNQDPKVAALRTQQSSQATTSGSGAQGAQGVPGALSNQPPGGGSAALDGRASPAGSAAAAAAAASGPTSMRRDESASYEVDKKIEHTRNPVGGIRRLTAAVVVNHRKQAGTDGKAALAPIPAAEMEQITALVREAMGFNKERGDSVNVVNAAFTEPEPAAPAADVPFWKHPDTIAIAKDAGRYTLFALLIGYLVFGLLRPTLRQAAERAAAAAAAMPAPAAAGALAGSHAALEDPVVRARRVAQDDPKIVANVVKSWVSKGE